MSNGHNHPLGCTCTFCDNSKVRLRFEKQFSLNFTEACPLSRQNISSHTPNATCPVCSEPVFFYKNEYGSAVFFDSLGPPWPKHPCTDNSGKNAPFLFEYHQPKNSTAKEDGWFPVDLMSIVKTNNGDYILGCRQEVDFSVNLRVLGKVMTEASNRTVISREAMCYLKKEQCDTYFVSLLADNLIVIKARASVIQCDN